MKFVLCSVLTALVSMPASAAWFAIINSNNKFLYVDNGGGGSVWFQAHAKTSFSDIYFSDQNGGLLMSGDEVCLMTERRFFLVAEGGGGYGSVVKADRRQCGPWEKFKVFRINEYGTKLSGQIVWGTRIALRSMSGYYVSVERDRMGSVVANRGRIGEWEQFILHRPAGH